MEAHLPGCDPNVPLGPKADMDEQIAKLHASSQQASQLEYSVAASESPEDCAFVCQFLRVVTDADAKESGLGLRSKAVGRLAEDCIHTAFLGAE